MISLSAIIIFIVVLGLLVLLHECGHALVARWCGVAVEEFGIGFPPRLFSKKKNNTLYSINLIPLGGFVKLKGIAEHQKDDLSEEDKITEHNDNFQKKGIITRLGIVSAGIIMNALVAVVLFTITYIVGFQQPTDILPTNAIVSNQRVHIVSLLPNSAAANAGIQPGDIVVSLNGSTVQRAQEVQNIMANSLGKNVQMSLERSNQTITVEVIPQQLTYDNQTITGIGVGLQDTVRVRYVWYRAFIRGVQVTVEMTSAIFNALGTALKELFINQQIPEGLTGPIGIAVITGQIAQSGTIALFQFAALLSINLALFNILPIPALDGGRLFFLLFELITKRKVNQKIELVIHQLGFVLLITLMVLVTYRDIVQLR